MKNTNFEKNYYKNGFYFEVRTERGNLVATFAARFLAEMFAEQHKKMNLMVNMVVEEA